MLLFVCCQCIYSECSKGAGFQFGLSSLEHWTPSIKKERFSAKFCGREGQFTGICAKKDGICPFQFLTFGIGQFQKRSVASRFFDKEGTRVYDMAKSHSKGSLE